MSEEEMKEIKASILQTERTLLLLEKKTPDSFCDDSRLVRAAHMLHAALQLVTERYDERKFLYRSIAA